MRGIVNQVLERLLIDSGNSVSSTQLAEAAGISRQAAHKHLTKLRREGQLTATGKARACRYQSVAVVGEVTPLRRRLEVATAGSLYRLSARLLLDGVESGEVTLDFTGVVDVGEEFLDEIFLKWAPAHTAATLKVAHLPARFAPLLFGLARRRSVALQSAAIHPNLRTHLGFPFPLGRP
jgi:DNA-binding transcriptional ArsR family regulator